jgi:glycosyltransferase involved in cell wall biosynthesis
VALIQLAVFFRKKRFDLVHSIMPKTGLLGMAAAWICGVPCRIHTFTGQVWVNKRGPGRAMLKFFDRLIVLFATHIIVDSPSQRTFLESEKIVSHGKSIVIGQGSICGVDAVRFHADLALRESVRNELDISADQVMVLYLGRLNKEKGILDLAYAFKKIVADRDVVLVLVGNEDDVPFSQIQEICAGLSTLLRKVDFTEFPERYMAAADIFCLPSYREGFGQVIIEAAACGVPAVASRIYGITDAVDEGKTGLLFPAGDIEALSATLLKLIDDPALRRQMGRQASERAFTYFNADAITAEQLQMYREALAGSGLLGPRHFDS